MITEIIDAHIAVAQALKKLDSVILEMCKLCLQAIKNEKKILLAGNGGSASDAQHIAAEFVGRFINDRRALPAIALSTDTSILTSVGNDYGFESIFSRQIQAIGNNGDFFIAISTSGNSPNMIQSVIEAQKKGIFTIGLLGKSGGELKNLVNLPIVVPSENTARIQEMHILIGHILCSYVDENL